MLSIKKYRELLGDVANSMSDEEVEKLREEQYRFVEIALNIWIDENLSKKVRE